MGLPVTLINDARAFTLAEGTIGAGRGSSTLVCVTLGTGIGGGLMFNGNLYTGPLGVAGEIAHQTVLPDGPLCGCGNRGCAEALAKADAIAARAGRATVEEVYAGVAAGDPDCIAAVEFAAYYLGIALANAVVAAGPGSDSGRGRDHPGRRPGPGSDQERSADQGRPWCRSIRSRWCRLPWGRKPVRSEPRWPRARTGSG